MLIEGAWEEDKPSQERPWITLVLGHLRNVYTIRLQLRRDCFHDCLYNKNYTYYSTSKQVGVGLEKGQTREEPWICVVAEGPPRRRVKRRKERRTVMENVQAIERPGQGPGFLLWPVRDVLGGVDSCPQVPVAFSGALERVGGNSPPIF